MFNILIIILRNQFKSPHDFIVEEIKDPSIHHDEEGEHALEEIETIK